MLFAHRLLGSTDPNSRIAALESVVESLLVEVEALRATMLQLATQVAHESDDVHDSPQEIPGPHTIYGRAYLDTVLLSHCAAGPTSGTDKVLSLFHAHRDFGPWRESLMLKRLGYSDAAIARFIELAESSETMS